MTRASLGVAIRRTWTRRMVRKALLSAGVAGVGVYAVGDLVCGLLYRGYSFRDQAISELSAYGSPVRPWMVGFITAHSLLLGCFGAGLWQSAHRNRALRWAAASLIASVLVTLPLHPFFPMSSRWLEAGVNDEMHIALTTVFSLLVAAAVALSAVAGEGWVRIYSVVTLAAIAAFGVLAGVASQGLAAQQPTPAMGAFERANAYTYFAWIVVLAVTLLRRDPVEPTAGRGRSAGLRQSTVATC